MARNRHRYPRLFAVDAWNRRLLVRAFSKAHVRRYYGRTLAGVTNNGFTLPDYPKGVRIARLSDLYACNGIHRIVQVDGRGREVKMNATIQWLNLVRDTRGAWG